MAEVDGAASAAVEHRSRSGLRSWTIIAVLAVLIAALAGGAGYWFSTPRQSPSLTVRGASEPPFYFEIKPFVVSIGNDAGSPHLVQLGINLALSGKEAGNAVTGIFPEIQDALRQTALAFKVEDIVTPAGVDRLRAAMRAAANRLLLARLGPAEANRLGGVGPNGGVVRQVYFSTLIVE